MEDQATSSRDIRNQKRPASVVPLRDTSSISPRPLSELHLESTVNQLFSRMAGNSVPNAGKVSSSDSGSHASAAAATQEPPVPRTKGGQELLDIILPLMGPFKALLTKRNQLKVRQASLIAHKNSSSIPKSLQLKDISQQVPASQPELRDTIQKARVKSEKESLDLMIESQSKELTRVQLAIHNFHTTAIKDFAIYLGGGRFDDTRALTAREIAINTALYTEFEYKLDYELLKATRQTTVETSKANAKRADFQKEKMEREEKMAEVPEPSLQQVVDAAINKRLAAPTPPSSAQTDKKKKKDQSKNGHPQVTKEPPAATSSSSPPAPKENRGSGNRRQPNKKSASGAKSPSQKSNRE